MTALKRVRVTSPINANGPELRAVGLEFLKSCFAPASGRGHVPHVVAIWNEYDCNENNNHVAIGNENCFLSADGYLMPGRKASSRRI